MIPWGQRPVEVANLLNPAFCGEVMRRCINRYHETNNIAFPFPLIYLILPIVLHKKTRDSIGSERQLHVWLQSHEEVKIGFAERTKQLVPITRETVLFLLQMESVKMDDEARLSCIRDRVRRTHHQSEGDIHDCYKSADIIGRWFARTGDIATIYSMWGIKP